MPALRQTEIDEAMAEELSCLNCGRVRTVLNEDGVCNSCDETEREYLADMREDWDEYQFGSYSEEFFEVEPPLESEEVVDLTSIDEYQFDTSYRR